jgi:hypothetical protein
MTRIMQSNISPRSAYGYTSDLAFRPLLSAPTGCGHAARVGLGSNVPGARPEQVQKRS